MSLGLLVSFLLIAILILEELGNSLLDLGETGATTARQIHAVFEEPEGFLEPDRLVLEPVDDCFKFCQLILESIAV
jgi:hypothetical protein